METPAPHEALGASNRYDLADLLNNCYGEKFASTRGNVTQIKSAIALVLEGTTFSQLQLEFIKGIQFEDRVAKARNESPEKAVDILYRAILDREADPSGKERYLRGVKSRPIQGLVDEITNSEEGRTRAITRVYQELLGRQPDDEGLKRYYRLVAISPKGIVGSINDVVKEIKASEEYKNRKPQNRARYLFRGKPLEEAIPLIPSEDIVKPEGRYSFVYVAHLLGKNPETIFSDSDLLFLETGMGNWLVNPAGMLRDLTFGGLESSGKIAGNAINKGLPVMFGDLVFQNNNLATLAGLAEMSILGIETAAGIGLLKKVVQSNRSGFISRRGAIQRIGLTGAGLATTAWLVGPALAAIDMVVSNGENESRNTSNDVTLQVLRSHPEILPILLNLRNTLIAEKEEWLLRSRNKEKHLTTVMGAFHVGIEDKIRQSSVERLASLRNYKDIMKKLVVPESVYQLALVRNDPQRGLISEMHTVPHLKELMA